MAMSAQRSKSGEQRSGGRKLLVRGFALAVGAVVVFSVLLSACSRVSTQPDEIILHYAGGVFEPIEFERCVNPSSGATLLGPGDTAYSYPFGQRTFDFSGAEDAESKPLTVVSKDNVEMKVSGVATFTLNTECKTLQQFHEKIGLKFRAYYEEGSPRDGGGCSASTCGSRWTGRSTRPRRSSSGAGCSTTRRSSRRGRRGSASWHGSSSRRPPGPLLLRPELRRQR
nr:hypothetical protein GCM10020093_105280 [Planobispora longispora]